MKTQPAISVIVPTRNRLAFLREAVASVRMQSFEAWELIVVDDASEDGTREYLQTLDEPRVRSLRMEAHRERSAARNAGFREARGEFVLFLDDDDWLLERTFARLLGPVRAEKSAIAAVGARLPLGRSGPEWSSHPRRRQVRDVWHDVLFGWAPVCGQALVRRSAIVEAGGWNEQLSFAEDHDLWLRLARLGPLVLLPHVVLGYRIHPGQTVASSRVTRTIRLRRTFIANLTGEERAKAARTVRAYGHSMVAIRAFRRGRYSAAWRHCLRSVWLAPGLLGSPLSRPGLIGLGLRSLTGMALGERAIGGLRNAKQAFSSALRKRLVKRVPFAPSPALGTLEAGSADRRREA